MAHDVQLLTDPDPLVGLFVGGRARTRADVIAETGFARSTVGPRLDALVKQGLLRERSTEVSTGGRRPTAFMLNARFASVAAVDLSGGHTRVTITDLAQETLAEATVDAPLDPDPDAEFAVVEQMLRSLTADESLPPLVGIGVGLAAPVDQATGRPTHPPRTPRWHGYDIKGRLRRVVPVPVHVDRNNNLMAAGELALGGSGSENMLYVSASTWIGAGVVIDGRVVRGSTGQIGHIGHVRGPWNDNDLCTCGKRGCLEVVAGGLSLVRRFGSRLGVDSTGGIVTAAQDGDEQVLAALRESGRKIGAVVAGYVSTMNPAAVVLGGSLTSVGLELINGVREGVNEHAFLMSTDELVIRTSEAGSSAVVLGASVQAAHAFLNPSSSTLQSPSSSAGSVLEEGGGRR